MEHSAKGCEIPHEHFKCALCGENHSASYKGCQIYKNILKAKKQPVKTKPVETPTPTVRKFTSKKVVEGATFASMSGGKEAPKTTRVAPQVAEGSAADPEAASTTAPPKPQRLPRPTARANKAPSPPTQPIVPAKPLPTPVGNSAQVDSLWSLPRQEPTNPTNIQDFILNLVRTQNPNFTWEGFFPKLMSMALSLISAPSVTLSSIITSVLEAIRRTNND